MDWNRKKKMMLRWSIVSGALIGLFWLIWYWGTGTVPVVYSIKITPDWTISLPFAISRWWDILIGPIWAIGLILAFTNSKTITEMRDYPELEPEIVPGLAMGLVIGLIAWLDIGSVTGLSAIGVGIAGVRDMGLGIALSAGLIAGLGGGIAAGLGVGLAAVLGVVLGAGLRFSVVSTGQSSANNSRRVD